ncbi:ferritin-like domain-containing protein (plasmid) [Streptomyces sp. BI20]|uniref:ferritin-like domain-containing protein n=1 Tax=Streptomyces sp. BI20 TaxID=3403460 RepID=UPI003C74435D
MSLFDLPRLHFAGLALTHLPTGPRNGLADLATHTALTADGRPVPPHRPAAEHHAHLDTLGPRHDAHGRPDPDGAFGPGQGPAFGGNGHFRVDARLVGVERTPGELDTTDPVIGRAADFWGHYNEYLGTTVNRARVFDLDPASDRTTTLMVGRFGLGRAGRSHDTGQLLAGEVTGFQPPHRHLFDPRPPGAGDPPVGTPTHRPVPRAVVHQFTIPGPDLTWYADPGDSPALAALRAAAETEGFDGLVVRFALLDPEPPEGPDEPLRRRLLGTVAPRRAGECRTHPAGRPLVPAPHRGGATGPHPLTLAVTDRHVTLDAITTRPEDPGAGPHELELRTVPGDRLLARIPAGALADTDRDRTGGLLVVDRIPGAADTPDAGDTALRLLARTPAGPRPVLIEREIDIRVEDPCLILEHPGNTDDPADEEAEVRISTLVRGRPAPVRGVLVRQYANPRALPRDPVARAPRARAADLEIVRTAPPPSPDGDGPWSGSLRVDTDADGHGAFRVRGARPGTTSLLLTPPGAHHTAPDPHAPGSAALPHGPADTPDSGAHTARLAVRILPDDRRLRAVDPGDVDFDLVWREVLAWYEHLFSFMRAEVFALEDRCKVETYAALVRQMCDPRNKAMTWYMPPTRDLSAPRARLLLHFLRAVGRPAEVPRRAPVTAPRRPAGTVTTREALLGLLRRAATLELAVMAQYLYAAWSVPTHGTGLEYVRSGRWTPEQLRLACGDGGETRDGGIRATLLGVAREEMLHFLLVNNVITALGEPFHVPRLDFARLDHELPVPLGFALEGLGPGSVDRFVRIEAPADLADDVWRGPRPAADLPRDDRHPYGSLGELYAEIRDGLRRVPDLFLVDRGRGGGEHHLFLRRSINARHPDYQLEVDDLSSALFAIDVIAEQGEGGVLDPAGGDPAEESHHAVFLRLAELLHAPATDPARPGGPRWSPAHPVLRNPTLRTGEPALETVTDPEARAVMELFDQAHFLALQLMAQHFGERPDASLRRSDLMNAAIDMMTGLMRPLAEVLVTLPSGRRGTTAGPSFELAEQPAPIARPDVARRALTRRLDHLAAACAKNPLVPDRVGAMSAFWADHFRP